MGRRIRLAERRIYVHAAPELVYQYVSAFGGDARVLERQGDELVVEFTTRAGRWRVRTVERVRLEPSRQIAYEQLRPLLSARTAHEQFLFHRTANGGCDWEYRGELHLRWGSVGWLLARLVVKPLWDAVIVRHMAEVKAGAEARALRSHQFRLPEPQAW